MASVQIAFGFLVNLQIGTILSLLLVPLLTLPLMVVHYRRFGRVGRRRALAFYLLVISVTFTIALTLFPLPDPDVAACVGSNVVPLRAFEEMARYAERHGRGPQDLLTNRPVFQYLLNIAMFMPLGVLLRRCYRWGWLPILAVSAGFSTLLELTQATGDWGLYPCAYRVGDVDDVIANTLGGLLGAAIAPLVAFLPDDVREVAPPSVEVRPALLARMLATGIDVLIAGGLGISPWSFVGFPVVFVLLPWLFEGATPGTWLLGLRLRDATGGLRQATRRGRAPSVRQLAIRAAVLFGPWVALEELGGLLDGANGTTLAALSVVASAASVAYPVAVLWLCSRRADGAGPHDRAAGTLVVATVRAEVGEGPTPAVA